MKTKEIALCGVFTALLFAAQVLLSVLPNIELVSLFIIVYTLVLGKKTVVVIYGFVLLEGFMYGFGVWWAAYLYVWTILYFIARLMRRNKSVVVWALTGGFFGLFFGFLCALPYAALGGPSAGTAWWIAGLPFDILHGIGNFITLLFLFKPAYYIIRKINNQQIF